MSMADKNASPLDAHAIELIQKLAVEAAAPDIHDIDTRGLGDGLPEAVPVGFDRTGQKFVSLKALIEEHRIQPARRKGTASVETLKSFVDLVNRHKDAQSALFGKTSWPEPRLTAVLNYDAADAEARFGDHRVVYAFPLTDEFKAWVGGNGKLMSQADFAAFLEEHAAELAAPYDADKSNYEPLFRETFATPSEMLSLSRELEVFVESRAKQGIRLQSGERVVEFAEEHQNAKGEKVVIPGIFMVSVPAFVDGSNVRIPARLRYRIAGGDIKWFYQLYRWESFLREEVEHALADAAKETGLPAFEGAPESGKAG
jgi:uncharacterized protein YfdQ (DUF2303 family)